MSIHHTDFLGPAEIHQIQPRWSLRRRILFILALTLGSWLIVLGLAVAVGYAVGVLL